jgi:hypothetical protein
VIERKRYFEKIARISLFSTASPLFFRISAMVTTVAIASDIIYKSIRNTGKPFNNMSSNNTNECFSTYVIKQLRKTVTHHQTPVISKLNEIKFLTSNKQTQ